MTGDMRRGWAEHLVRRSLVVALVVAALPGVPHAQPSTVPIAYGASCFEPVATALQFCVQNTQSLPVRVGYVFTSSPEQLVVPIDLEALGGARAAGGPTTLPGQGASLFVVTTTESGDYLATLPVSVAAVYLVEADGEGHLTLRVTAGTPGSAPRN